MLRMVTIDIAIHSTHGEGTVYPAGMCCPAWGDAFDL